MQLGAFAARILPQARADWGRAMLAELHHCDADGAALRWAVGCLIAALGERMTSMIRGDLKISSWIALPEMLLCFAPLTIGWIDAARALGNLGGRPGFGGSGPVLFATAALVLATTGPAGLLAALRVLLLGRPVHPRWLPATLLAGSIINGLALVAIALIGGGAFGSRGDFNFWCGLALLSALPALGAAHLPALYPPSSLSMSSVSSSNT